MNKLYSFLMDHFEEEFKETMLYEKPRFKIAVVLGLLFLLSLLYALGFVRRSPGNQNPQIPAVNDAERTLEVASTHSVAGKITKIEDTITIDIPEILGVAIPLESHRRVKTVLILEETILTEREEKSDADFEKEFQAYLKRGTGNPPAPFHYTELTKEDLKVGDWILVKSEGDADIKDAPIVPAASIERIMF